MTCEETLNLIDEALERAKEARAKKDWGEFRDALMTAYVNSQIAQANETGDAELNAALERAVAK